jgi:hypothetical protein
MQLDLGQIVGVPLVGTYQGIHWSQQQFRSYSHTIDFSRKHTHDRQPSWPTITSKRADATRSHALPAVPEILTGKHTDEVLTDAFGR